jgi:hypothetical protein
VIECINCTFTAPKIRLQYLKQKPNRVSGFLFAGGNVGDFIFVVAYLILCPVVWTLRIFRLGQTREIDVLNALDHQKWQRDVEVACKVSNVKNEKGVLARVLTMYDVTSILELLVKRGWAEKRPHYPERYYIVHDEYILARLGVEKRFALREPEQGPLPEPVTDPS